MVVAMVGNPGTRSAGTIETREKNQKLLDGRMKFYGAMSETTMVADCRSQAARAGHKQGAQKYLPARQRKQYESHSRQYMNGDDINHDPEILSIRLPPRRCPRVFFG